MRTIFGLKIGGLQQKIFNLLLIFIILLIGVYTAISVYQQKNLSGIVQDANAEQQASITEVSEQTMESVLSSSMAQTTALQAYIANDLFAEVKADVLTLKAYAEELFEHADSLEDIRIDPPSASNDGITVAQLVHEEGVDPADSETLRIISNMTRIMKAIYDSSDRLSSVFVGTADGNMVLVNDRSGTFTGPDGEPLDLDIRHRPWYVQAAEAGQLIFTGVELDAYTSTPMIECAAPVYRDGELAAVVSADIYLEAISDYVENKASEGSFVCVVNDKGQMLFSPVKEGVFKVGLSSEAEDLRKNENSELASFVALSLKESTGLRLIEINGKEYYMCGSPMETVGWSVLSVVEKELTMQPTNAMLAGYNQINEKAVNAFTQGAGRSVQTVTVLIIAILVLALAGALIMAKRIVRPIEHMTNRVNELGSSDRVFEMEDVYRTGDEIEVLAESFASMSGRTKDYITQIAQIAAEKERIGAELSLATRIQYAMMPHIYPAFPERPEIDIYASMDPAKEVGGDFYDFFLIDDDHLGIVMADVSGKGVPAALFMMASKIILQSCAMLGQSPGDILTKANQAICSNNQEEMFVTAWVGILELSTGRLTAANAGHEYPVIRHADGPFEIYKDSHGLVIGAMDGVRYKQYELKLDPGDKIFVYTDGVPEASDKDNSLFGTERMLAALNEAPGAAPEQILKNVRSAVDGFVSDAEQFDDITMLCVEFRGKDPEEHSA